MAGDDFVYLDFAVVTAPQIDVLLATARLRADLGGVDVTDGAAAASKDPDIAGAHDGHGPDTPPRNGAFGGLRRAARWWFGDRIGGAHAAPEAEPGLFLHCDDGAEAERLITWSPEHMAYRAPIETRVSALAARPDWSLVEFADPVSGMSMISYALSEKVDGHDVYYFRRSGDRATETQFDFHHYLDGEQRRRVMSHLTIPTGPDAQPWWEGYAEGPPAPFENPALYDGAAEAEILTAAKQETLLLSLGLPAERLFGPGARVDPVLISEKPGGAPLAILFD